MNEAQILTYLPALYFIKGEKTRYGILKELKLSGRGKDYSIVNEFITYGFIEMVNDNPPTFTVSKQCKKNIWQFINQTEIGKTFMNLVRDRTVLLE